jgi:hypothetical protein
MRKVLIIFASLAALKVWAQDRFYRSVMQDALVQGYRERAQVVCLKEAQKPGKAGLAANWPAASAAEITIGTSGLDVAPWDFDNPLWDVRFRHPHLVLTADDAGRSRCSFDMVAGLATLSHH